MPYFTPKPSSSIAASVRNAMAGSAASENPLQQIAMEQAAAKVAHESAMAAKARQEVEEAQRAEAERRDPARAAAFASNSAGLDLPTGARLAANLRGDMEQPGPADVEDAAVVGREAEPYRVSAPDVTGKQRGVFQAALAALEANRVATGKTNAEQLLKAAQHAQENSILAAAADAAARGDVSAVNLNSAGVLGKKELTPFKTGENGVTTNEWVGTRDETGKTATSNIDRLAAQAVASRAAAGASSAHAGLFKAQADKARQDFELGAKGQYDSARGILVDPRTGTSREVLGADGQPIGKKAIDKALPNPAIERLQNAGNAVEDSQRLAGSFKPEFGGKTLLGDFSNTYKRVMGDETGQAQWWQDMDALQNQTRHVLFGSALTATELKAWEKTSITPRMDADQIQKNLNRRVEIEARAASKLARAYEAGGYNKDQIRELLGVGAQYLDNSAPPVAPVGGFPKNTKPEATKTVNGKTYVKINGQWYEQ